MIGVNKLKEKIKDIKENDFFLKIDKEIKAIGTIKVLGMKVTSIEELFSIFLMCITASLLILTIGIKTGKIIPLGVLAISFVIAPYISFKDPIDKYKARLMQDDELPAVIETLINGLYVGMPIEKIMKYIKDSKTGYMREIIKDALNNINAGIPLEVSLNDAAERSLNKYFKRAVRILSKSNESTDGLYKQLSELLVDIEEEKLNMRSEKANSIDNLMAIPITVGYFIPLIVVTIYPSLVSFMRLSL